MTVKYLKQTLEGVKFRYEQEKLKKKKAEERDIRKALRKGMTVQTGEIYQGIGGKSTKIIDTSYSPTSTIETKTIISGAPTAPSTPDIRRNETLIPAVTSSPETRQAERIEITLDKKGKTQNIQLGRNIDEARRVTQEIREKQTYIPERQGQQETIRKTPQEITKFNQPKYRTDFRSTPESFSEMQLTQGDIRTVEGLKDIQLNRENIDAISPIIESKERLSKRQTGYSYAGVERTQTSFESTIKPESEKLKEYRFREEEKQAVAFGGAALTTFGLGAVLPALPGIIQAGVLSLGTGYGTYETGKFALDVGRYKKEGKTQALGYRAAEFGAGVLGAGVGGYFGEKVSPKVIDLKYKAKKFYYTEMKPELDQVFSRTFGRAYKGIKSISDVAVDFLVPKDMFLSKSGMIGSRSARIRAGRFGGRPKKSQPITQTPEGYFKQKISKSSKEFSELKQKYQQPQKISILLKVEGDKLEAGLRLKYPKETYPQGRTVDVFGKTKGLQGEQSFPSQFKRKSSKFFENEQGSLGTELINLQKSQGILIQKGKIKKLPKQLPGKKLERIEYIYKEGQDIDFRTTPVGEILREVPSQRKGFRPGMLEKIKQRTDYKKVLSELPSAESTVILSETKIKTHSKFDAKLKLRKESRIAQTKLLESGKGFDFIGKREIQTPQKARKFETDELFKIFKESEKPKPSRPKNEIIIYDSNKGLSPEGSRFPSEGDKFKQLGEMTKQFDKNPFVESNLGGSKRKPRIIFDYETGTIRGQPPITDRKSSFVGISGTRSEPPRISAKPYQEAEFRILPDTKISTQQTQGKDNLRVFTVTPTTSSKLDSVLGSVSIQKQDRTPEQMQFRKSIQEQEQLRISDQGKITRQEKIFDQIKDVVKIKKTTTMPRSINTEVQKIVKYPSIQKESKIELVVIPSTPMPRIPRPRITKLRTPKTPPKLPPLKLPKFTVKGKGFNVYSGFGVKVKKKGKYRTLFTGLTQSEAIKAGQRYTDVTTSRSFKIFQSGTVKRKKTGVVDLLRYRRGKRDPFSFVEKSKFAISTGGEKKELRQAKLWRGL